jgi:hypothetical protein
MKIEILGTVAVSLDLSGMFLSKTLLDVSPSQMNDDDVFGFRLCQAY